MANVKYGRKFTAKTPYYKILERKNYEIEKKNVFLQSILKNSRNMVNPRDILIANYNYDLPDERIAKYPLQQRDQSKLLVWRKGEIEEKHFFDLPELIPAHSMIVFNNTKVIQARLHFHKETGGMVEVFCLEPEEPKDYQQNFASEQECTWTCLVGNSKKWKSGALQLDVTLPDGYATTLYCERAGELGASQKIRFYWDAPHREGNAVGEEPCKVSFAQILDAIGELPIPPYLNRSTEEKDKETYQTVYSRIEGSVAAPTAGLHYTEKELFALRQKGVDLQYLTLHVGAGTFKPVKSATIEGHDMHTEFISVPRSVIQAILDFKKKQLSSERTPSSPRFVATGTTSIRTLESLYYIGEKLQKNPEAHAEELIVHQWEPYEDEHTLTTVEALQVILDYLDATGQSNLVTATQILIAPSFQFRLVDTVITNFHMPQSTLLLLVSAFVDGDSLEGENWHRIYRYAMEHDFRFLSYGDSSILFANDGCRR